MTSSEALSASAHALLSSWSAPDPSQEALRVAYLHHIETYDNAMFRDCRTGHVTASTLIIDPDRESVLLTLHPIVGRWLQTGGHCERDDAHIIASAEREALEESGIPGIRIDASPLRLDRHAVMCRPAKQALPSELHHLDVQFLGLAPAGARERRSEESVDLRWWTWSALPPDTDDSVRRLVATALDRLGQ